jgi:CheY-like chemotaxis protein
MAHYSATILVAEDDENDLVILSYAFKQAELPHKLHHVPDGEAAIAYLLGSAPYNDRRKHPLPDLLLLDLKMPKVSGFDVLAWLQTQPALGQMPVIVLSGSELEEDKLQCAQLGADDFQTKAGDFRQAVRIVKEIDARWLNGVAKLA